MCEIHFKWSTAILWYSKDVFFFVSFRRVFLEDLLQRCANEWQLISSTDNPRRGNKIRKIQYGDLCCRICYFEFWIHVLH
jgi:hypothetical protein